MGPLAPPGYAYGSSPRDLQQYFALAAHHLFYNLICSNVGLLMVTKRTNELIKTKIRGLPLFNLSNHSCNRG